MGLTMREKRAVTRKLVKTCREDGKVRAIGLE